MPDSDLNKGEERPLRNEKGEKILSSSEVADIVAKRIEENNRRWEKQIAEMQKKETPPAKSYSRAQLADFVSKGQMSQDQANVVWDKQQEEKITSKVVGEVGNLINNEKRGSELQGQINEYFAFDPALREDGSDAYKRIQGEITEQMRILGVTQQTKAVELAALRSIYGPSTSLKNITAGERDRQTHEDINSRGGMKISDKEIDPNTPPSYLTADEKRYYADQIARGTGGYKDWDDVHKEMKFADQKLRARVGAR